MSDPSHTPSPDPDFPWVRFDSGPVVCEEALIRGQYLGVHWSAMGRPQSRQQLWTNVERPASEVGAMSSLFPLASSRCAFALEIDGQLLSDHWEWVEGGAAPSADELHRESVVALRHTVRPVRVEVHTRLDGTAILERWLVIHNTGSAPAAIAVADPWSGTLFSRTESHDLPLQIEPGFLIGRFRGVETLDEGEFGFEPMPAGGLVVESRIGSSGFRPPYFIVRSQATGESFVGALAYSGNWRLELHLDDTRKRSGDHRAQHLRFRVGPLGPAPIRVLAPGESVTTPSVHLGLVPGDLDACVDAWHTHLRLSVIPAQPERLKHLVEYNHGGNTFNRQIAEEGLIAEAEMAAALGAELFTIDAGWFGDTASRWMRCTGDWSEHQLLPRGLAPVFAHARSLGMRCGLWFEIEGAGRESRLAKDHPDWLMTRNGQTIQQLDLAKPDVARHVEDTVSAVIEKHKLDCFRLDYNIRTGDGGQALGDGYVQSTAWRYCENLWRIIDNLRARFPDTLFQNCASGGARNDLGMLGRFHYTQLSDNFSPAPSLKILNGSTIFLTPAQCAHMVGTFSKGVSDADFVLRIGLFGHVIFTGGFPSMEQKNAWQLERSRRYVELYKRFVRPILDTVRVFHHTPCQSHQEAGDWLALEYATPDGSAGYAGIWRLVGPGADEFHFKPRGLRRDRRYRVTLDTRGEVFEVTGDRLVNEGLRVRVNGNLTSELLLFEPASSGAKG